MEARLVVPIRRGLPVTPGESGWIIKHCATDLTSRSLEKSEGRACRVRRVTMGDQT